MAIQQEAASSQLRRKLPPLKLIPGCDTQHPVRSPHSLAKELVFTWEGFEEQVTGYFASTGGLRQRVALNDTSAETIIVGNEIGLSGQFFHNVGHTVAKAWSACFLDDLGSFRFHDPQVSGRVRQQRPDGRTELAVPDFIISETHEMTTSPRIVGELRSPWTMGPGAISEIRQGQLMGQVVRQMRLLRLRYAVISTYDETFFIQRTEPYRFETTRSIRYDARGPSVNECFFYLGYLASIKHKFVEPDDFDERLLGPQTWRAYIPESDSLRASDTIEKANSASFEGATRVDTTNAWIPMSEPSSMISLISRFTANTALYGPQGKPTGIFELARILKRCETGKITFEGKWNGIDIIGKFWPYLPENVSEYDEWGLGSYGQYDFRNELDMYHRLPKSRFIHRLLDYGNVILANYFKDGRVILLEKIKGSQFSSEMWESFTETEREKFTDELMRAFRFLKENRVKHGDASKANILWNREAQQVVFLGLEGVTAAIGQENYAKEYDAAVRRILNTSLSV
ncbi:hypothetical protein ABW21_db0201053 [Orbilia brochopaga]|nr:hypothetical protein ABW21_db0201053 [Drechslerella brochopaga]